MCRPPLLIAVKVTSFGGVAWRCSLRPQHVAVSAAARAQVWNQPLLRAMKVRRGGEAWW